MTARQRRTAQPWDGAGRNIQAGGRDFHSVQYVRVENITGVTCASEACNSCNGAHIRSAEDGGAVVTGQILGARRDESDCVERLLARRRESQAAWEVRVPAPTNLIACGHARGERGVSVGLRKGELHEIAICSVLARCRCVCNCCAPPPCAKLK